MTDKIISCRDVWKLYGKNPQQYIEALHNENNLSLSFEEMRTAGYIAAVRHASFEVTRGEILVIMGLSGSGKSTLVRCLSRLIDITSGHIEVEGQNLSSMNEKELIELRRNKMGMVFQNFALLPHRTVLDNVAFPLEMRGQDRITRRERAMYMINLVSLNGRENYFPRELSGGQQQRVGIARSLVIEPDIWFLDEPFSALDPLIRREMQSEFLRLQKILGKTIVFITHDFDEALRLADRIAIMKDGYIEQISTPDRIVLYPATEYVSKFTADIEKARVIRAGVLARQIDEPPSGMPISASATILELSRQLVNDNRNELPVTDEKNTVIGSLNRQNALDILFADSTV